eukprot:812724_1
MAGRPNTGWKICRKRNRKSNIPRSRHIVLPPAHSANSVIKDIERYISEIQNSTFYKNLVEFLKEHKDSISGSISPETAQPDSTSSQQNGGSIDVVCYGIGSMARSQCACKQFALLLLLTGRTEKNAATSATSISQLGTSVRSIELFEPTFTPADCTVAREWGLTVLTRNEEGKRRVDGRTLFYMPHCSRGLYNNVVWANWGPEQLQKIAIVGNSFSLCLEKENLIIGESHTSPAVSASLRRISQHGLLRELPLPSESDTVGVFNDLALHVFPQNLLSSSREGAWSPRPPEYMADESDPELIPAEKNSISLDKLSIS